MGAAVVLEGRTEIIPPLAVGGPRGAGIRGVIGDNKLTRGVEGVGGEVNGLAVKAVIGRAGGVKVPGAEVV
jgi:hypothetical protein